MSVRRHPKGDTASRGTPRKPGRSSRPPGAIDERVELGVNEGRRARREVTFLRWVVSGALIYSAAAIVLPNVASAREYRSREVTREFQREHPCPSIGRTSDARPGYRKDHVKPLACGALTRFGTYNGRPSPRLGPRTGGSGRLAATNHSLAVTASRAAKPMNVKQYVLSRLDQGERDLNVLARQARIQFPSVRVTFSYIRGIRNEWQKASTPAASPALPEFAT